MTQQNFQQSFQCFQIVWEQRDYSCILNYHYIFPQCFPNYLNSIKKLSMKVLSTSHKWCLFYDSLFLKPIIKINFDDFVSFCQCWFCQSFCEVVVWRRFLGLFINFCDLIQNIYESWIIFVKISFQKNRVKVKNSCGL